MNTISLETGIFVLQQAIILKSGGFAVKTSCCSIDSFDFARENARIRFFPAQNRNN